MAGNLQEWCWDWIDYNVSSSDFGALTVDPVGPQSRERRAQRGGGFIDDARYPTASARASWPPDAIEFGVGQRPVRWFNPSVPDCSERQCGDNGCGVACGQCGLGLCCQDSLCQSNSSAGALCAVGPGRSVRPQVLAAWFVWRNKGGAASMTLLGKLGRGQ